MGKNPNWSVMLVDDEEDLRNSLVELIEGQNLTDRGDKALVTPVADFDEALSILESRRFDLAILDVRLDEDDDEAGAKLQQEIANARFVPVIFYTGWPMHVAHLKNPPFIDVVPKGDQPEALLSSIRTVLNSQLPAVNRTLIGHFDKIQREYMWEFVASNWERITEEGDGVSIAYLLARRLASSLSDQPISQLAEDLTGQFDMSIQDNRIHPMQYYVMPPMNKPPSLAGDIYRGTLGEQDGYWVMLTPSCDLVQGKAEWTLLALCLPLREQPEFQRWLEDLSKTPPGSLKGLLGNNRKRQPDRFFYLPGALSIPDLVVDLQNVVSIPRCDFDSSGVDRLATLDSPFAEALASRFTRLFGRIGTPDLDISWVTTRLSQAEHSKIDAETDAIHKDGG